MQQWGTGRVAWSREGTTPQAAQKANTLYTDTAATTEPLREGYVPAIETMTEKEIEKYLDAVRARKPQALEHLRARQQERIKEIKLKEEEGRTSMVSLTMTGYGIKGEGAVAMSLMNGERIAAPNSKVLISQPHALGGIAYSTPQFTSLPSKHVDPAGAVPGRALKQQSNSNRGADTNSPWIAASGGLVGMVKHDLVSASTKDKATLKSTDYTGQDLDVGTGTFRVAHARIVSDPTVLNLSNHSLRNKYDVSSDFAYRPPESRAKHPKPLDTFYHNIEFDVVDSTTAPDLRQPYLPLGSREYVAASPEQDRSRTDGLGIAQKVGQARQDRQQGQALRDAQRDAQRDLQRDARERNAKTEETLAGLWKKAAVRPVEAAAGDKTRSPSRPSRPRPSWRDSRRSRQ